jgi:head-tail adaptor
LSAADLSEMAAIAAQSLTAPCTVSRPTLTIDALGGQSTVWTTVATTVCRVTADRARAAERVEADRDTARDRANIDLPLSVDVRAVDRVTVAGRTFDVLGVSAGTFDVTRRCSVVEVT